MRSKTKIAGVIAVISVFISILTVLSGTSIMQSAMINRLELEGNFIATTLKEALVKQVARGEAVAVLDAIEKVVKNNSHIEYIFMVDFNDRLFAHSFVDGFPKELEPWLGPSRSQLSITRYTSNTNTDTIIHISEPLIKGMDGYLYVGMNDRQTKAYINQLSLYFLSISLGVMVITITLGILFSNHISAPLIQLTKKMAAYGQGHKIDFNELSGRWIDVEVKNLNATFQAMVSDIQKNIAKLEHSQASLANAQKITHIGNWDWNIAEGTLFWSDEIYRIFGLTPNDFTVNYDTFLKAIHPEDRSRVADAIEKSLADSSVSYYIEHRISLPSGEARLVHEQAEITRDSNGTPLHMTGTVQDITERKKNEQELNLYRYQLEELVEKRTQEVKLQARIIDQIHDAVIIMELKGNITFWNKGAERVFCYSADEVLGKNIILLCPKDDREPFAQKIFESTQSKGGHEIEMRLQRADGTPLDAHLSLSMIIDDQNEPTAMFGYFIDITARKKAETALKVRTDELSAVNKELESFSYSVSHDLRAPLRGIDGFSLALLEDYGDALDDNGKDYLHRVRNGTQRMAKLIDDLLQLSRVTRSDLKVGRVNLSLLANEIINELQMTDTHRQVDVTIEPNIIALGDSTLLRAILQNLLGNAWKFTQRQEKACIEFGMLMKKTTPVYCVRDNGVGFNMRYADKLFRAFQRLHSPEQFEGTGIGLATVQRIINRHDGRIWAESEVNKGAIFYFTLDYTPYSQQAIGQPDASKRNLNQPA